MLCGQELETCDHLFTGCLLTRELWFSLIAPAGLVAVVPVNSEDLVTWWLNQRARLDTSARPAFDSLVLLVSWII